MLIKINICTDSNYVLFMKFNTIEFQMLACTRKSQIYLMYIITMSRKQLNKNCTKWPCLYQGSIQERPDLCVVDQYRRIMHTLHHWPSHRRPYRTCKWMLCHRNGNEIQNTDGCKCTIVHSGWLKCNTISTIIRSPILLHLMGLHIRNLPCEQMQNSVCLQGKFLFPHYMHVETHSILNIITSSCPKLFTVLLRQI